MPYYTYYPFDEEILEMFSGVFGVLSACGSALSLVCYVFTALSLYTIAKRRGLKNPWLAWIPVGFEWLLGTVSDQYQYLVKERNTSRRKLMLCLSLITMLSGVIVTVVVVVVIFRLIISAAMMTEAQIARMLLGPLMTVMILSLLLSTVAIVLLVFRCMSMYDLYRSCQPDNAVLYLVLGILFGFLEPIFLMIVRNKDEGMPPRRPEPQYTPEEPAVYETPEPWEESE